MGQGVFVSFLHFIFSKYEILPGKNGQDFFVLVYRLPLCPPEFDSIVNFTGRFCTMIEKYIFVCL